MKRIAVACVLALAGNALAAETTAAQLVQACQSLKRQADRDKCLELAVNAVASKSAAATPVAPGLSARDAAMARAQKAIDASLAIQSVTSSGTSLQQYTPYVQQFSIALDQFRAATQTPEEKDAAALLTEALQAYSDVGTYWQADIDFFSRGDYRSTYPGAQPTGLTGTRYILDRYDVPITKADIWGLEKGAPLSVAANVIWGYARAKTNAAKDVIANIGAPKPTEQSSANAQQATPAPEAITKSGSAEENAAPYKMLVDANFQGGTYSAPDYSSARWHAPVAGATVSVYESQAGWARVSPRDDAGEWLPFNQLSSPN